MMQSVRAQGKSCQIWHRLVLLVMQAALLLNVWDILKPRYDPEAMRRPKRPVLYNFGEEPNVDDVMGKIASVRKLGNRQF